MKSPTITTEQLIALVTQKTEHLNINDGRVADTITERTVRYYVCLLYTSPSPRD